MIFTSAAFLIFFPIVFGLYWFVLRGKEARLWLLLVASAVFYGWWDWRFLGLIGIVILLSYVSGLGVARKHSSGSARGWWLAFGVGSNLAILAFFKYFNFFVDNGIRLIESVGFHANEPMLRILLPVGVSFYVFQAISYVIDVYRGHCPAENRLSRVALYIAFFPQLVAGPIVRAAKFFPQMEREKRWSNPRMAAGLRAFATGFVYKALIADNLAPIADPVFADMGAYSNAAVIAASMVFAAQMYFDFAGYTQMAVGVGRFFGYTLPINFRFPFTAASTTEYWRRWHISLSNFLRDYLYIPLGGNRGSTLFYYRNLFLTMFLGGLWHGAAWTFVVWGTLQGVGLIIHKAYRRYIERPLRIVERVPKTVYWIFGVAVTQAFVVQQRGLFRAESWEDGLAVFGAFLGVRDGGAGQLTAAIWMVPVLVIVDALIGRRRSLGLHTISLRGRPTLYWSAMGAAVALALAIYPLEAAPFVYFQF